LEICRKAIHVQEARGQTYLRLFNAGNREEANEAVRNNIIDVQESSLHEIILLMLKNLHSGLRINKLSPLEVRDAVRLKVRYLKVK